MMKGKGRVLKNMVCNCLGMGTEAVVGFLIAPLLIYRLGETNYGLWIILGSLTSYFGLLDLGVRGSIGRHIAFHHGKKDQHRINETLSTALAILGGVGVLATVGTLTIPLVFFHAFEVPADQVEPARLALLLIGINLGLSLVLNAFDATLWGFQRFDLLNAVDVPAAIIRACLTFFLVGKDGGLVTLAVITLLMTVTVGGVKASLSFLQNRELRVGRSFVKRAAVKELFGYSVWSFLCSVARIARVQMSPVLIGVLLGVTLVTPFAITNRLITVAAAVLVAASGIVTPWATGLHARGDEQRQRQLFLIGGRYCSLLALFLFTLFLVLARSLLQIWVGPKLADAVPLLIILAAGELLPNTQWVTNGMIFAAARHRMLAWFAVLEVVVVAVLTLILTPSLGLLGVCIALAVPAFACRGLNQVVQGCRLFKISLIRYVLTTFIPAAACAAIPGLALAGVVAWRRPETLPELLLYGAGYTVCFGICCVVPAIHDFKQSRTYAVQQPVNETDPALANV